MKDLSPQAGRGQTQPERSLLGHIYFSAATMGRRRILSHTAAAREGGCARGCKSHPPNWTVHGGTARCLSPRKAARGVSSPGIEPMGLNEDEPQLMSLVTKYDRSRRVPGVRMKADAGSADNRQPLSSPAGSAWQARREGQPHIKRGERSR